MTIDWAQFTPWTSFLGGMLIGLAASLLVLFNGRIAGISGIVGNLFASPKKQEAWRWFFVAGLLLSAVLYKFSVGYPPAQYPSSGWVLIVAGLLVGFGARLGSGCTSGHGICGLSRLSRRSLAATLVFMTTAATTVYITRHLIGG
ncbi:MAG: YeeE/YedE family protein [Burkholderiales bacterium]|jgi:uncharacterized membrane protein YedE/YeeE|nr:YeeE/YedE family protein [Burkholderiales bacterium]